MGDWTLVEGFRITSDILEWAVASCCYRIVMAWPNGYECRAFYWLAIRAYLVASFDGLADMVSLRQRGIIG